MDKPEEPNLKDLDFTTATWRCIREWAEYQIAFLRAQNDSFNVDQDKTNYLRGQIKANKKLLALAKPKIPAESAGGVFSD